MGNKEQVIEAVVVEPVKHQKRFDLVEAEEAALPAQAFTPMTMIEKAMSSGADLERLEKLWDLQVKFEEREAKKAYSKAVAAFKTENVKVFKESHVSFRNKAGTLTEYDHANLANFVEQVAGKLSVHDLSHSWSMSQDNGQITVTCTLSHIDGHSESVSMSAGADESGGKNKIQAVASTNTYLQRYTFKALLGLAEHDNDGRIEGDVIDESQLADLEANIDSVGGNINALLKKFNISDLNKLPKDKYKEACELIEKKRRAS